MNEPVIVAYISSEKKADGTTSDYFSTLALEGDTEVDMNSETNNLTQNAELVNKTLTDLKRYDNTAFTATMFDKKNGNKMIHDALIYLPITHAEQQIYLSLENDDQSLGDYLLVMTTPEELQKLGQVTANKLQSGILKEQFGLFDFDDFGKAAFRTFSNHTGQVGIPTVN